MSSLKNSLLFLSCVFVACSGGASETGERDSRNAILTVEAAVSVPVGGAVVAPSPDGRMTVVVENGAVYLEPAGEAKRLRLTTVTSPARMGWDPTSRYLFVSDGQGSGQWSYVRLYDVSGNLARQLDVTKLVRRRFLAISGCGIAADSISTPPIGWFPESSDILIKVESFDRETLCDTSPAFVMRFDVKSGTIEQVYTRREADAAFCSDRIYRKFRPGCT